jgi:hypothetical protein
MFPLGCLPLWGREGVTFLTVEGKERTTENNFTKARPTEKMVFPSDSTVHESGLSYP